MAEDRATGRREFTVVLPRHDIVSSAMTLQAFSFPSSETRFFEAGRFIYKFKIRGGSSYSGEETMGRHCFSQELEEIIRTVLGNLKSLQPFSSTNFNVFPYEKPWEGASNTLCKHHKKNLKAYPFILILYLEKRAKKAERKSNSEEEALQHIPTVSKPRSKRYKQDSPLEEAILQNLMKDLETESKVPVVKKKYRGPHAEDEVKETPGYIDKEESGFCKVRGSRTQDDMQPGMVCDISEEEVDEEEENEELTSPVKPGFLSRLASHIFPLSLFFRDT